MWLRVNIAQWYGRWPRNPTALRRRSTVLALTRGRLRPAVFRAVSFGWQNVNITSFCAAVRNVQICHAALRCEFCMLPTNGCLINPELTGYICSSCTSLKLAFNARTLLIWKLHFITKINIFFKYSDVFMFGLENRYTRAFLYLLRIHLSSVSWFIRSTSLLKSDRYNNVFII